MPQGKIKKGFFFYFGLFVLLLIAIFLIILVILMFNPGKTILWFKYFTSSPEPYVITQTTEEDESLRKDIDLSSGSSIETIEIEATYADVLIQKNTGYAEGRRENRFGHPRHEGCPAPRSPHGGCPGW